MQNQATTSAEPVVSETTIDGVTTFWCEQPGPLLAGLFFRVGVVDETAPTRGLTHLCEHLALAALGESAHPVNGTTTLTETVLYCQGNDEQVAATIQQVCRNLSDPRTDRLDGEKRILRAEASRRTPHITDLLLRLRFGLHGPGLLDLPEHGLWKADAADVAEWYARWFTADNAVLMLTGPPPPGLRLDLPSGPHRPLPITEPLDEPRPFFSTGGPMVALGAPDDAGVAGRLFAFTATRRLRQRLRHQSALSYDAAVGEVWLGPNRIHRTLSIDAAGSAGQRVAEGLHEVLVEMADGGVDESDRRAVTEQRADAPPETEWDQLQRVAKRRLYRVDDAVTDPTTVDDVALEQVVAAARAAIDDGIYVVPADTTVPGVPRRVRPEPELRGVEHRALLGDPPATLVRGSDGLLVRTPTWNLAVEYSDVAAVLSWADGTRHVFAGDGSAITVAPAEWRDGPAIVAGIDQRIPDDDHVPVGLRGSVPRGDAGAGKYRRLRPALESARFPFFGSMGFSILMAVAVMLAFALVVLVIGGLTGDIPAGDLVFALIFLPPPIVAFWLAAWAAVFRPAAPLWKHPQLVDHAQQHLATGFPVDQPHSKAFVRGGLLLAWLVERGLTNPWLEANAGEVLDAIRRREGTPGEHYRSVDGILALDMVADDGAHFLRWYTHEGAHGPRRLDADLQRLAGDQPTAFHLDDSWPTYDAFRQQADARYRSYHRQPRHRWVDRVVTGPRG